MKNYAMIGSIDCGKGHFLRMFLAASRVIDYLASRPDWDGRTLVTIGTSQGGLQAIVAAALNPKVSGLIALIPTGYDPTAPLVGRAPITMGNMA